MHVYFYNAIIIDNINRWILKKYFLNESIKNKAEKIFIDKNIKVVR